MALIHRRMPGPPDLAAIAAAFDSSSAQSVVIGGFAVIANRHVRATEDVDLLIPEDPENHVRVLAALDALGARFLSDGAAVTLQAVQERAHLRLDCGDHGILDLLKEGEPPLDFASVAAAALYAEIGGTTTRFAGLASTVAFKRLAGRVRDRQDLEALAEVHGDLPILPIPGLDDE